MTVSYRAYHAGDSIQLRQLQLNGSVIFFPVFPSNSCFYKGFLTCHKPLLNRLSYF